MCTNDWIKVTDEMPKAGISVLVFGINEYGKSRRLRACWLPKYFEVDDWDDFQGNSDYNEEEDKYYWPEGWYEWNEFEETHWKIDFKITHWMYLPKCPEL